MQSLKVTSFSVSWNNFNFTGINNIIFNFLKTNNAPEESGALFLIKHKQTMEVKNLCLADLQPLFLLLLNIERKIYCLIV